MEQKLLLTGVADLKAVVGLITLCLMTSCFSQFIACTMEKGMIFEKYRIMLEAIEKKSKTAGFLLKPLGLCIYCYSTWIYIVSYSISQRFDIVFFFGGMGISYIITEFLTGWLQEKRVY